MNAHPAHFPQEQDAQAEGHAEYRARRLVRELRMIFGAGGTRELLERLQTDFDERERKCL